MNSVSALALLVVAGLDLLAAAEREAATPGDRWDTGEEQVRIHFAPGRVCALHKGRLHVVGAPDGEKQNSGTNWVARLDPEGWTQSSSTVNGWIDSMLSWQTRLLLSGEIHQAGTATNCGLIVGDKDSWRPFPHQGRVPLEGRVEKLASSDDGALIAAGASLRLGNVDRLIVARHTDQGWQSISQGLALSTNARVRSVWTASGGRLYLLTKEFDGFGQSKLWYWPGSGAWQRVPAPDQMGEMVVAPDGSVYVGGNFGVPYTSEPGILGRWDGDAWQNVGEPLTNPSTQGERMLMECGVTALCVWNGDVIVGGTFRRAGDLAVELCARWDGSSWHALGLGLGRQVLGHAHGKTNTIYFESQFAATFVPNTEGVYALGPFDRAGGRPVRQMARWDGQEWSDPLPAPELHVNGPVGALARMGSSLVALGEFSGVGQKPAPGLAVWNGAEWSTLDSVPPDVTVDWRGLLTSDESKLWLKATHQRNHDYEGDLLQYDGVVWSRLKNCVGQRTPAFARGGFLYFMGDGIQRWDGNELVRLADAPAPEGHVGALSILPDGRLCAMLGYAHSGAQIEVLNAGGWTPLDGGLSGGFPSPVIAIDGTTVYAGGAFTEVFFPQPPRPGVYHREVPLAGVATWRADEGWSPMGTTQPKDVLRQPCAVNALACWRGQVFAGGHFRRLGGTAVNNIARWDGTRWHALEGGVEGDVNALQVIGDYLYVGGRFLSVSGKSASNLARWRLE